MLEYGLRPGELLRLRIEDVEIGAISALHVLRRPQDPDDERSPRPQIKRNGRTLIIEDIAFARAIDEYILVWRELLCASSKEETEYLTHGTEVCSLTLHSVTSIRPPRRSKSFTLRDIPFTSRCKSLTFRRKLVSSFDNSSIVCRRESILA